MRKEYQAELNGYSNYMAEDGAKSELENFTLTFSCTPYTYESGISGIISNYSADTRQGILVGVKKRGIVSVKLGLNNITVEIESLAEHMKFQQINIVSIAFWGTAGWCDLYINGVLANRKQFPRHSRLLFPEKKCYIGKYVDEINFVENARHGVFHGNLGFIEFVQEYQDYGKIMEIHNQIKPLESNKINLYEMQDFSNDIYKPVYHLMPPGKWMNEPHAPFFYKGKYHIFYQANPHAPVWDNLCWGHLVSEDMIGWSDAGIALYPDNENIDIDGCWSGSACKDKNGDPVLFYTAGNNKELPNQSVAVACPKDKDDLQLKNWVKEGVILRQKMGNGFLGEFRDPFVWRKGEIYFCLVGSGDEKNGGGNALVFTSKDLKEFICHGFLADYDYETYKEVGHVWELPVLLPLNDENGKYCCDILLFCACQIEKEVVETYYFLGKFDYDTKKFHRYHEEPGLIDLGNGTFTGPSGFVTPDGRSVVFTIAQGKRNPEDEYRSGWAHNGGMPIQLWMEEGGLHIAPISEIRKYFSKCIMSEKIDGWSPDPISSRIENLSEHYLNITSNGTYLELILEWKNDGYIISYDKQTKEWKALSKKDHTLISKIRDEGDLVDIDGKIKIECYIDHSLIELYLNDKKSMTLRSYPFCEKNKLYVKTDGTGRISAWEYEKNAN